MKKTLLLTSILVGATMAQAGDAVLQLSLTPDIALQSQTTQINGLALNIWGENPQHSLTLGVVNGSTGDSKGLSLGFIANYADSYTGVQFAFVNISQSHFLGWQSGAVNFSEGDFTGLQTGAINVAQKFKGLQLGMVNYAENLEGLQVGAINVARNNGWFDALPNKLATGFPFVNWSF